MREKREVGGGRGEKKGWEKKAIDYREARGKRRAAKRSEVGPRDGLCGIDPI